MIVHPRFLCFEPAETDVRYQAGVKVDDAGDVRLYLGKNGRPTINKLSGYAVLHLLKSGNLICKDISHRRLLRGGVAKDAIGVYNCEHLAAVLSVRQQDSVLLENILSSLFDMRGSSTTVSLGIQIEQDLWRDVWFTQEGNGVYSIAVDGHDPHPAGYITPAYEGFRVVRDLVIQHYEAWTEASRTMCTSTQHWKSGNTREADLKDRLCLDSDKMCYPCAKRSADAVWEIEHPSNDAGFDSLAKVRPKKSESFVPVPASSSTMPLSPFAGGPPTTSGSRRVRSDGSVEIFDGKKWQPASEVPFNLLTFFNEVDEQQWNKFLDARDSV